MPGYLRERMTDFHAQHVETVRRAYELGARIAMGTDAGTPGNHHGLNAHELVFMVDRCGLSPIDSVRAATVEPARLLRRSDDLGRLVPGALADVVGCRADPLADITEVTRLAMVMKGGDVVRHSPSG
jgi:imidazolonepropionase-like amidohydrolase